MTVTEKIALGDPDPAFRQKHVGASEVAALFGCSPYITEYELYYRKQGTIAEPEFPGGERAEWGLRLEPAVIAAAADRYGYTLEDTPRHLSNGKGLGGHPDRFATCPNRGPGLLEVKTVDWLIRKGWGEEPPDHYLLQAMAYAGLAQRGWCDIIVLVGGNSLERFEYEFRPGIYASIEKAVETFWQRIRAGDPPKPDFARDGDTLAQVLGEPTDEVRDLRCDNRADELAREFLEAKAAAKEAETRADAAKCELLLKIGDAGRAILGLHRITCGQTKGTPDREITQADVGTIIKGRKGYRQFLVKEAG